MKRSQLVARMPAIALIIAVATLCIVLFKPSQQPDAMQALAKRGDTTAIQGPFENGSTVPVFRPVKILDCGYLDPRGRLNLFTFVYEQYPYSETPMYDTKPLQAAGSNQEKDWEGDSLGYVYWVDQLSDVGGTTSHPYFIDGSVGRNMLMQKQAVVYGGERKRSQELY